MRIGVISDTHGLLRPEAIAALEGCDTILHAGDIGHQKVLDGLHKIAPVIAVRGNIDRKPPLVMLPEVQDVVLGNVRIYMTHRPVDVPEIAGSHCDIVVCGHSHKPLVDECWGTPRLNPGSAGPRRFSLPISLGFINIRGGVASPEWRRLVET